MDAAIAYKRFHFSESYAKVAARFDVPASTLHDRLDRYEYHAVRGARLNGNLSIPQEDALLAKINEYGF